MLQTQNDSVLVSFTSKANCQKYFLKSLFACGNLITLQLSFIFDVNSVVYEVRSSVSLAVLLLCLGHWCPLVDWSSSINQVELVLTLRMY